MMIKLIIKNNLEDELYKEVNRFPDGIGGQMVTCNIRRIKPYDEEKWKNGKIYEFNTLKEVSEFIDSCDIDFTEEYSESEFGDWNWEEIDIIYIISKKEDNLIELYIGTHIEFRD